MYERPVAVYNITIYLSKIVLKQNEITIHTYVCVCVCIRMSVERKKDRKKEKSFLLWHKIDVI